MNATATSTAIYKGAQYDMTSLPEGIVARTEDNKSDLNLLKWSGTSAMPAIGQSVAINFNGLGTGTVVSYFWEHGYIGVAVKLDKAPAWHVKQSKGSKYAGHALVFGSELC